ncbi:uncharacterized protein ARMOST_20450 [Armillaria ostoyae]|uniref:Uncharacterized protein n=1 Tax=Armillaria ostoyae TaxID=47428 RepID=A0A284S7D2_ARMOS|nr:uncharacterized protein ARMOST_20450 [Armillaria ostoyae]
MSAQSLEAIPSIDTTFGACYIGTIIAAILFGISNLQVVIYYKRYPNDWWVYRYSVALLWVLDTLHVGLSTHALYFYLITMFGDLSGGLENGLWSMKLQLSLNISLVVYVQWYEINIYSEAINEDLLSYSLGYMRSDYGDLDDSFTRFFHLSSFWLSPPHLELPYASTTSFSGSYFNDKKFTDLAYEIHFVPNLLYVYTSKKSICIFFSTIEAADFIIVPMMCYYLHKSRRDIMFTTTGAGLIRLMRLVLISGLATR